ncbi:AbiH family protein [Lactococcus fujiensis]|uniref:Uncharacterized protein n=1 Tax=Lactococcus fujiensis JCM 16395 TaxID=1291764 RepID=A0A2A5RKV0_9LACT|nr:AbiH family protein [Lactococcus fujiensis]PCR99818.1 hypothetical protein RT41_GL001624 [Lactococcus fujiensis JCM 16395]
MLDPNIQMPNFSVPKLPDLSSLTRAYPQQVNIVENQKAFNQLVILGNGFDLACGLKSTYRHFFEYILDKDESKNNYWYYIFRSLHYRRVDFNGWTDIEKQILIELKNIEIFYSNGILKENEYIVKEQLEEFISFNGSNPSLRLTASAITSLYSYYYEIPSKKSFQEQLIKKLLLLEEDFCKYLIEQINIEDEQIDDFFSEIKKENLNNYYIKSLIIGYYILTSELPDFSIQYLNDILTDITEYDSFDLFFEEIDTINKLFSEDDIMSSILSFNYTEPLKQLNLRNIHGALSEGNILFGIDYDKLKDNFTEPPIEFSKSYRILESGRDTKMNISSDIDIIKFYGHGLGEADYSYFQAIFDSVDLYHSNTKIIFYWSQYEGVDKKTIRVEQVKNVTNLIEEYGTTFTNQDHGRNLLTKLQLENRLQINEIPINNLFECLI